MIYYTTQGDQVSAEQIKQAVAAGAARIIYSRIGHSLSLDGHDFDTRGQCHSVWDEQWSVPPTLQQALSAAVIL